MATMPSSSSSTNSSSMASATAPTASFPTKLYTMLDDASKEGFESTISWQPDGESFKVHKIDTFTNTIMQKYFNQTKYKSFQRQLNIYGWKKIQFGPDKGGYKHPHFIRGRPELFDKIHRQNDSRSSSYMKTIKEEAMSTESTTISSTSEEYDENAGDHSKVQESSLAAADDRTSHRSSPSFCGGAHIQTEYFDQAQEGVHQQPPPLMLLPSTAPDVVEKATATLLLPPSAAGDSHGQDAGRTTISASSDDDFIVANSCYYIPDADRSALLTAPIDPLLDEQFVLSQRERHHDAPGGTTTDTYRHHPQGPLADCTTETTYYRPREPPPPPAQEAQSNAGEPEEGSELKSFFDYFYPGSTQQVEGESTLGTDTTTKSEQASIPDPVPCNDSRGSTAGGSPLDRRDERGTYEWRTHDPTYSPQTRVLPPPPVQLASTTHRRAVSGSGSTALRTDHGRGGHGRTGFRASSQHPRIVSMFSQHHRIVSMEENRQERHRRPSFDHPRPLPPPPPSSPPRAQFVQRGYYYHQNHCSSPRRLRGPPPVGRAEAAQESSQEWCETSHHQQPSSWKTKDFAYFHREETQEQGQAEEDLKSLKLLGDDKDLNNFAALYSDDHQCDSWWEQETGNLVAPIESDAPDESCENHAEGKAQDNTSSTNFPFKLHMLLDNAEQEGYAHLVSWVKGGKAFKVHDYTGFVERVMSMYFDQSRYESFRRQLNLYQFTRVSKGEDRGVISHPCFMKGARHRCHEIRRRGTTNINTTAGAVATRAK